MRHLTLALILSLAACGGNDPVADKGITPPDNMVGDAPGKGLASPTNSGAAETVQQAATPLANDGAVWRDTGDAGQATLNFGPPGMRPMLVLSCTLKGHGATLTVVRGSAAPPEGLATMSFTGSGHVASLTMNATAAGDGDLLWSGVAKPDDALAIAKTFDSGAPVEISVGGAAKMRVPVTAAVRAIVTRCAGRRA